MTERASSESQPASLPRLDAQQRRIVNRLSTLVGAGAPLVFRDAVQLMNEPERWATVTLLVSHLLRETEGVILDVLAPREKRPRKKAARAASSTPGEGDDDDSYRQRVERVISRLELDRETGAGHVWLTFVARREQRLNIRAHRTHLDDVRPLDDEFRTFWSQWQDVFDAVLDAYEAKFTEMLKEVENLLAAGPSKRGAEHLRSRIPDTPLVREHFFERAGPEWMPTLYAAGVFESPRVAQGDALYRWCQSTYLKRIATVAAVQADVAKVLAELEPQPVLRMHMDLLEAARALPPALAAGWAEKEAQWIETLPSLIGYYAEELATFAGALADAGACAPALRLARALLSLRVGRPAPAGFFHLQVAPLFDHYHYARVATALVPAVKRCPRELLVAGIGILAPALTSRRRRRSFEDDSINWCERIDGANEDDDQVAASLVHLIRDAARASVSADNASLDAVCADLRGGGTAVFRRIELDLLTWCADAPRDRVTGVLMERELFTNTSTWLEYSVLLRRHWGDLDAAQRETILTWIDEGPAAL